MSFYKSLPQNLLFEIGQTSNTIPLAFSSLSLARIHYKYTTPWPNRPTIPFPYSIMIDAFCH